MKKKSPSSKSAFFNPRVLISFAFCAIAVFLTLLAFALYPGGNAFARQNQSGGQRNVTAPLAATINVPGDYPTIQAAVAAANPGDTILVAAGTYAVSGANINKALTLQGAQAGVDARDGRPAASESIISGSGFGTFHLSAADITFDGFKFSDLQGRELDSTTDADNFTMRNCILEGASIDPGYNTGAIQFGGPDTLHANGLLFEHNLVTADNGQLFYMGHAMDNGTVPKQHLPRRHRVVWSIRQPHRLVD